MTQRDELCVGAMINAMFFVNIARDYSCEAFGIPPGFRGTLASKIWSENSSNVDLFKIFLEHTSFLPSGRMVFVFSGFWDPTHLICHTRTASQRLKELEDDGIYLDSAEDCLFVFESGEAIVSDHDNRLFWARSGQRRAHRI
ncbi:MAG: hypothetical protein AAFV53_03460 [Myxococcota bacterium]